MADSSAGWSHQPEPGCSKGASGGRWTGTADKHIREVIHGAAANLVDTTCRTGGGRENSYLVRSHKEINISFKLTVVEVVIIRP